MPVFISHDQDDKASYSLIALLLKPLGCWSPDQLEAGQLLSDQLRAAIGNCEVCVFLVTQRSLASTWCAAEVGAFWGAGKPVIAFVADPAVAAEGLPDHIREKVWTRDATQVVAAVQNVLKRSASHAERRPANVFWLAHDLARAIRFAMFETENRDELRKNLMFSLNHLSEVGIHASDARSLLLRALGTVESGVNLSREQRQQLVKDIARAKNEMGSALERLQQQFKAYPSIDDEERFLKEARATLAEPSA
jgi:TIR domain